VKPSAALIAPTHKGMARLRGPGKYWDGKLTPVKNSRKS